MFTNMLKSLRELAKAPLKTVEITSSVGVVKIDPTKVKYVGDTEVEFVCFRAGKNQNSLRKIYRKYEKIDKSIYPEYIGRAMIDVHMKDDTYAPLRWEFENRKNPEIDADHYGKLLRDEVARLQNRSIYYRVGLKIVKVCCVVVGIIATIFLIIFKGKVHVR